MFGKRVQFVDDSGMADSEEQEYRIDGQYLDNQTKRFLFEQMQEQQRQNNLAAYAADQQRHSQASQSMDAERLSRAAQVKANGGRWIALPGNCWIDGDGNIVRSSDLR